MDQLVGQSERYRMLGSLGSGGQGHTFRALDRETGDEVAVKRIRLRDVDSWKSFELFERECEVLKSLDNPGIPKFLDTFADEDAGEYFLVMELVKGRQLRSVSSGGQTRSETQLWNLLHQSLDILEYLHSLSPQVIHRDIKPANLILRPDGRLMLVDFGGVRVALRPDGGSTMVGTFGYMAPEQLHGEATTATDIFGLGATLAALAAGLEADKLPRDGLKVNLESVMPPSLLRVILGRMMEPDPTQRLATVAEVRDFIDAPTSTPAHTPPEERLPKPAPDPSATPHPTPVVPDATEVPEVESDLGHPVANLPGPLQFVAQFIGVLGYTGLVLAENILLPLIYSLVAANYVGRPKKLERARKKRDRMKKALAAGQKNFKALALGKDQRTDRDKKPRLPGGRHPHRRLPGRRQGRGRGRHRR